MAAAAAAVTLSKDSDDSSNEESESRYQRVQWRKAEILVAFLRVVYSLDPLPTAVGYGHYKKQFTTDVLARIRDTAPWRRSPTSQRALNATKAAAEVKALLCAITTLREARSRSLHHSVAAVLRSRKR